MARIRFLSHFSGLFLIISPFLVKITFLSFYKFSIFLKAMPTHEMDRHSGSGLKGDPKKGKYKIFRK